MKDQIVNLLQKASGLRKVSVESPENEVFGDYSTNIALIGKGLKVKGESPKEIAEEIAAKLSSRPDAKKLFEKVEVAGPGFVNFWLKRSNLFGNLEEIVASGGSYGKTDKNKAKKVIVEYSSPNIAKPFTIGHLRSTIIGDAIANLLEAGGWKVYRDNHLGDWGTQFGKQIYAIKTWGNETKIEKSENPVKQLVDLYVKFHEEAEKHPEIEEEARAWFKKLEDGDSEARRLWKKCVDWSWKAFEKIYSKLGVTFSPEFNDGRGLGESFFENEMGRVIEELGKKKLLKEGEDGAKLVFFEGEKYPPLMILKKDGATLYATRDLATDKYRKDKFDPDLVINEVGAEQNLYFRQIFEIEKMLGWYKEGERVHVGHGLVRFKEGRMSTRKGNAIWLEDVLSEAEKRASKLGEGREKGIKDISEVVSVGALKWNDLKRDPKTEVVFDWDEILNMEGNSGPYLQYTVARTNSVLAKANNKQIAQISKSTNEMVNGKWQMEISAEESSVLRSLIKFPEIVEAAAEAYAPNLLCNYLYNLAQKYNGFYNVHNILNPQVKGKRQEVKDFRIALTAATGQVLKNGLKLLGIQAPERM